ncbi:MAG TPA: flagellar motor protein MotA [Hyphomicrobiaceae bacterium]|jgi:hypothetical protein|nr:flagellar motor protein MotA [Hyphomicrobiaceae bacterium]
MARARGAERGPPSLHRTLFTPGVYLWRMFVFLVLVGLVVAVLHKPLEEAMLNNPGLNGLILVVLFAGILYSFQQVLRLYPEVRWVNAFRIADPGLAISHRPVLLAPMATMLRDRTGSLSLSATSMRSIMDSIGGRLDEARDTGRYLVGLLVFLGLLGTFWGLLDTITSVGRTIAALDTKGDSAVMFDELKTGLAAPLRGMGTAFSSSLLGLGGSLVLGFLELQASHAHGRFYNQLEEWLSGITELAPAGTGQGGDFASQQLYAAVHDMHRAVLELGDRIAQVPRAGGGPGPEEAVKDLAKGVDQLVRQMRAEQKVVREWVDEQAAQQSEVASVLKDLASTVHRK